MKFNSQICTTRKQSERLLSLGLKKETADMTIHIKDDDGWYVTAEPFCEWEDDRNTFPSLVEPEPIVPAWSLHRLIEMMPETIRDIIVENNYYPPQWLGFAKNNVALYDDDDSSTVQCWSSGNLYDDVIDCIEFLIDGEYFNKECLEE